MANLTIHETDDAVTFSVKVVPGSSRTALAGILDGMLKVKVAAPAEKGKANKSLVNFLAKELDVKKSTLSIISGQANPIKNVQITGLSIEQLLNKLNL